MVGVKRMRFIGNKELIVPEIVNLLKEKNLLNKNLTFFDAFCGTGAVSDALKDSMLQYSHVRFSLATRRKFFSCLCTFLLRI